MDISKETQFIYTPIWGKYTYPNLRSITLWSRFCLHSWYTSLDYWARWHPTKCVCFHLPTPSCELRSTNCRTRDSVRRISCSGAGQRIRTDRLPFLRSSYSALNLFRSYGWITHSTALGLRRQQADIILEWGHSPSPPTNSYPRSMWK
jgi:hypothetical protein